MNCSRERKVTSITGVVETELKNYGSFTAVLPTPIEITSNYDYVGIGAHEVECLIPQEVLHNQTHRIIARKRGGIRLTLKIFSADTVFNNVAGFLDYVHTGFKNLVVRKNTRASAMFGLQETTTINLNDYFKIDYYDDGFLFTNSTSDIFFTFVFARHIQYMLGMRWSSIYVRPLSVVRQNCYLSIDNYNFNEFLVIELEGIERTITKNGSEPILCSFYKRNDGSGRIHYKAKPYIHYKKIETTGQLRELNFQIKSVLGDRPREYESFKENRCTKDTTKNSSVRLKYEIVLAGSP